MAKEKQEFEDWLDDVRLEMYNDSLRMGNEAWRNMLSENAHEAAEKYGFTILGSVDARHEAVLA